MTQLFDPEAFEQIKGQTALDTDWCEQAACPVDQCVGCSHEPLSVLAGARSFYVRRVSPEGREGWTGSLRPLSRALREAQAWIDSGWTAEVVANTPATRAKVRRWEKRGRRHVDRVQRGYVR